MRHTHDSNPYPSLEWYDRAPSRRLRKLYTALEEAQRALRAAQERIYWPDHAPTDHRQRLAATRPLREQIYLLQRQIDTLQND